MSDKLIETWSQPVVVENIPGPEATSREIASQRQRQTATPFWWQRTPSSPLIQVSTAK
jgi:hypothetical protein